MAVPPRRYKIVLAYDGTAYSGYQRQDNGVAVQQRVEEVLEIINHEPVRVYGSSRTDAGVHAREYVLNFYTESTITCRGIVFGMNSRLPDDIGVKTCEEVPQDFHARFDCAGKEYEYIIHNSEYKNPFYMNSVVSYQTSDYVLATATAPATRQYNVYLNAYFLQNTYYSATQVRFRIYTNGTQSGSFSLSYQSQDPHGEQSVPLSIYASAGDVITIEYKYRDNLSGNFELNGYVSIS